MEESESGEDAAPVKVSVDKEALQKQIDERDYNMALHFTKKLIVPLDPQSKARAFALKKPSSSSKSSDRVELMVSFHGNMAALYSLNTAKQDEDEEEEKKQQFKVKQTYGELECHKQGVRGVAVAPNDQVFATNSFDSVKVWSVDLFMYAQRNNLQIQAKQSLEEQNVLSMAILPGNKYMVLGTKEG